MHRLAAFTAALATLAAPAVPIAYGEPVRGFPSWSERVLHEWTNRARCDPQVEMAACGAACPDAACYAPNRPVDWRYGAARAARLHAGQIAAVGSSALSDTSPCTLDSNIVSTYPDTCGGEASCACVGGTMACNPTCTDLDTRLTWFGVSASWAETVEYGDTDPNAAFYGWLREASTSALCGTSSNVHRWSILKVGLSMGAGMSGPVGAMVFSGTSTTTAKIPSGAHYPRQAATIEAWANWHDTAGPQAAAVVVDGACTAMTRERGSETNGAWRAVLTGFEAGCHRYYFAFKDSGGTTVTYPTTGSLGIGDAACSDFTTERAAFGAGCQAFACDPAAPGACDDGNPCTADACDPASGCTHAAVANGTSCSDADACDGVETCQSGVCTSGTPLACDDGNACTADACDPASGCTHVAVANGTSCSDADACDGVETCQSGVCAPGAPLACDDGNPCTADACDPGSGCAHPAVADGTSCSDADACNGVETCQSGACTSGTPLACDDGNPCTVDRCDPALGCAHESASAATECSDGVDCNGVERCDGAGACAAGTSCVEPPPSPEPPPAPTPPTKSSGCGSTDASGAGGPALALVLAALLARARSRRRTVATI